MVNIKKEPNDQFSLQILLYYIVTEIHVKTSVYLMHKIIQNISHPVRNSGKKSVQKSYIDFIPSKFDYEVFCA